MVHFFQVWRWCINISWFVCFFFFSSKCSLYFFFPGCLALNCEPQFSSFCWNLAFNPLFPPLWFLHLILTHKGLEESQRRPNKGLVETRKYLILERGFYVLLHCFPQKPVCSEYSTCIIFSYYLLLLEVKIQCMNLSIKKNHECN